MWNFLTDWALHRARKAVQRAQRYSSTSVRTSAEFWSPRNVRRARAALARSYWWHDVAAWLDGIGQWPGFRTHTGEDA